MVLIAPYTIMTKRGTTVVNAAIRANIEAPKGMQIAADGGHIYYNVVIDPNPTVDENQLMYVLANQNNPASALISLTVPFAISDVAHDDSFLSCTTFRALRKKQP